MIVIDTSVAVKYLIEGELFTDIAQKILSRHLNNNCAIVVPDLFYYEIGNTLATKALFPSANIVQSLQMIYKLNFKMHHPSPKEIISCAQLAKQHHTSVYDMLYAVIAKNKKCQLITADRKFATQSSMKHVVFIADYQE
jgi:predicted nucleic acid-binding protein